jgi:predicted lactoylglutathione lyase
MATQIFVNLPVASLRSQGIDFNPQLTEARAACMVGGGRNPRDAAGRADVPDLHAQESGDARTSIGMLIASVQDSRAAVEAMVAKAVVAIAPAVAYRAPAYCRMATFSLPIVHERLTCRSSTHIPAGNFHFKKMDHGEAGRHQWERPDHRHAGG